METAYRPEAWHDLYVALCGSAAALAGLLFLATSMHIEEIVKRPRTTLARASNNTGAIMFIFVEAALVLIPQSATFIGSEVVLLNLAALASLAGNNIAHRLVQKMHIPFRLIVGAFTWAIGVAGGICLIFQRGEGMYLVTASVLYGLCVIVYNGWAVLLSVSEERIATKS